MRQAIPDPLRSLVYYERPVHSAAAIAAVVVVLALTLCNCNFTLVGRRRPLALVVYRKRNI